MLNKAEVHAIRKAMKRGTEITRTYATESGENVRIDVLPAPEAWAPAVSIATLRYRGKTYSSIQHFDRACDLEEAMKTIFRRR